MRVSVTLPLNSMECGKTRLAQNRYGSKKVYTDFRKMLEVEEPQAVFCVGGPKVHYPVGI